MATTEGVIRPIGVPVTQFTAGFKKLNRIGGCEVRHHPSILDRRSKFRGLHSPPHPLGHGLASVTSRSLAEGPKG